MEVIRGIRAELFSASVVTMGMFDGVHLGHQALLNSCCRQADRLGMPSIVLTYEPHPTQVLQPEHPVRLLTTFDEKLQRISNEGIDYVVVPEFTLEFSRLSAERFIKEVVVSPLHPAMVVVGYRTTFGHDRAGNADLLREYGARFGFQVEIVSPVVTAGGPVSSSRIRKCLEDGDVVLAAELLGYGYRLTGSVISGDARGREIGFPTANLEVSENKLVPADGVYAVDVIIEQATYRGVINIGARPTFNRPHSIEVHILDFQGDLSGQQLTVSFLQRLRDIRQYENAQALVAQIEEDVRAARSLSEP